MPLSAIRFSNSQSVLLWCITVSVLVTSFVRENLVTSPEVRITEDFLYPGLLDEGLLDAVLWSLLNILAAGVFEMTIGRPPLASVLNHVVVVVCFLVSVVCFIGGMVCVLIALIPGKQIDLNGFAWKPVPFGVTAWLLWRLYGSNTIPFFNLTHSMPKDNG